VTAEKPPARRSRGGRGRSRGRRGKATPAPVETPASPVEEEAVALPEPAALVHEAEEVSVEEVPAEVELPTLSVPEPAFAGRFVAPGPRPMPSTRRAVFFDVENTSRPEHIARVLAHLAIDWTARATELVAVGNWRVVSHETARLLARQGAQLVHSAPSTGVRDWSDLRIAVGAGVWLAGARPGDVVEVVSDDQAFDAVGDVATSLGVTYRRLSYRALAGVVGELPVEESRDDRAPRRRRRGSRRGGGRREPAPHAAAGRSHGHSTQASVAHAPANGDAQADEAHSAPPDEIVDVIRDLGATAERGVSIDAVSNALKARGFRRPPGSLRLITRLRRIKELDVSRNGTIRILGDSATPPPDEVAESPGDDVYAADAPASDDVAGIEPPGDDTPPAAPTGQRRRRRRGGRRRRGRGGSTAAAAAP